MSTPPPLPPPPRTTAPSVGWRKDESMLNNLAASSHKSSVTEDDISFLPDEITRLHRDMADMLDTTSPMVSMGASSSGLHSRGRSDEIPRTLSDSEDDFSDDPALGELRDSLRSSTERFFIRRPSQTPVIARRRASEISPESIARADRKFAFSKNVHHSSLNLGHRHNGLSGWEKSMGSVMGRSISKSTSCSPDQEQGLGGGSIGPRTISVGEEGFIVRSLAGSARLGTLAYDDNDDVVEGIQRGGDDAGGSDLDDQASIVSGTTDRSILFGHSKVNRELFMPPGGDSVYTPSVADTTTPTNLTSRSTRVGVGGAAEIGMVAGEVETPRTRTSRTKTVLTDVWARSEDTGRILEALKRAFVEEVTSASITPHNVRRASAERLGLPQRRESSESGGGSSSSSGEKRMPLLLLALDHIEQITSQVSQLLQEDSNRRATDPSLPSQCSRENERHQWQRRRPRQASLLPRTPPALPRVSSALLLRRRSAKGQVEPISCGVPRYRIQVGRLADEVYYEVAITQARSMWTVERRLDEFVILRRALVATAAEQAAAAAAAAAAVGKRQRGSSGDALPARGSFSGKGNDRRVDDDAILEADERVPELGVGGNSWLKNSSLGMIMSRRKREEVLAERQVLLASWLANVLADPELMSADLVRFLGGSDGGVLAQPVIAESFGGEADEADGIDRESDFTEFDESGDWPSSVGEAALNGRGAGVGACAGAGANGVGIGNDAEAEHGKQATLRRSSPPLRATQLIPALGQRVWQDSELVVDSDAEQGGGRGQAQRNWRFGDEKDGVGTAMFVENTSPVMSFGSTQEHEAAPSPSSKLSTPPRQISVDAFFRAPT